MQFARSLALKVAVSDQDAIDKVVAAITEKILKEERAPMEEDGS